MACELCQRDGGELLFRNEEFRVVLVDDADYPGFCRVIWNAHAAEMTGLDAPARARLMAAVFAVEQALLQTMAPRKINLASFGNMVPHLHWHVIPRYADDPHFPGAVWAQRLREPDADQQARRRATLPALREAVKAAMTAPKEI